MLLLCVSVLCFYINLFLQVPSITEIKSNGLDQSHHDENSHKDELVVVWQGRILQEMTITAMQINELSFLKCD